jgi:hypothetical protein
LRIKVAALRDFDPIITPSYGSSYPVYLPNGGPQSRGHKMTATARILFTAAPLEPLMAEICRHEDNQFDTSSGYTLLLSPLVAVWPVR